ncbi:intercellular adhesion molecule 5 [Centroberyx affinis]|uniref:intercellular adhesion molecule 5 n=1 Tax=Centroberyx affinis TaxID=166261 RepID=UPI003A5C03D4
MLPLRMLGLLILILCHYDGDSVCPPESNPLTLDPPELMVEHEQSFQVNCSSTTHNYDKIFWSSENGIIDEEEEMEFITLVVANMSDWDVQHQCKIKIDETHECSKDLRLTVYKNPESVIMFPISSVHPVVEGTQYQIQCDIINVAPVQNLTVRWYQGNENIRTVSFTNTTKKPVSESSILTLSLSREDNGAQFRCEAQLDLGPQEPQLPTVSSETQTLSVEYKPVVECQSKFTVREHNFSLSMMPCQADGNPPASVKWYHQGRLIDASQPLTRMDSGEIEFIATNKIGRVNATIVVTVEYAPEFHQRENVPVVVTKGSNVSLVCEADGNPPPEIHWAYDAAGLDKVNTAENQSNLNIIGVTNDTTYFCIATNKLRVINKPIFVQVETISTAANSVDMATPGPSEPRACPLELMPARPVVRYGDQVSVNCSTSSTDHVGMGWEAAAGGTDFRENVTLVTWSVEQLKDWNMSPKCYITLEDNYQCLKMPFITLYKTPDTISVSVVGHAGLMMEGTEYHLQCDIINVAPVQNLTVRWYRGNETVKTELINDPRKTPGDVSRHLTVIPTANYNGAEFRCEAQLYLGPDRLQHPPTATSAPYIASVLYKPLIQACPSDYTGVEHNFTLSTVPCQADGNPPSDVQWQHQGRMINKSMLLTRMHSGTYIFEAVNIMGRTSTSIDITVEYGPAFTCDDRYEVIENAEHQIQCKPEGKPEPLITWLKDGKKVPSPVRLRKHDSGKYSLTATNKHGEAQHPLYVDVLYAPEFQQGNDTVEVTRGSSVSLVCSAEGNPPPKLHWNYISAPNVNETTGGRQRNIIITGATYTNTGIYICVATNKVGTVTRSTTLIMKDYTIVIIGVTMAILFIFIALLITLCYCKTKHGQYDFLPVRTKDGPDIPMTPQSA